MINLNLSAPLKASIELTTLCNYRCEFCEPDCSSEFTFFQNKKSLSFEQVSIIIRKLSNAGVVNIFLTGGEPTILPYLDKIVARCTECNIAPSISTNGSFLTLDLAQRLRDNGLPNIQISFQSADPNINFKYTGRKNSFIRTVQGIKNAVTAGINTSITSIGMEGSIEQIPETVRFVSELGVDSYRLLRLMTFSRETFQHLIPSRKLLKISKDIRKACLDRGIEYVIQSPPGIGSPIAPDFLHPVAITCYAGKVKMDILTDGSVFPCRALRYSEFYCGNILEESVEKIWNAEPMKRLRSLIPDDYRKKCGDCKDKWGCYSCRAIAYKLDKGLYNDDVSCYRLTKK